MKISEIIIEAEHKRRSQETSMLEAIDFIQTNCSEIVASYKKDNKSRIFRGFKYHDNQDFFYGDSNLAKRASRNTHNFYTLIMDNSSEWKKYPKRSESFVCSSDDSYASDFGRLTLVFPVDGTKIGICPTFDIWGASEDKNGGLDYDGINRIIHKMAIEYKITIDEKNYENFKSSISELSKKLKSDSSNILSPKNPTTKYWDSSEKRLLEKMVRSNDLNKFLESTFSSEGFELQTTKNFKPPSRREMWFSGRCVFVNAYTPINVGPTTVAAFKKAGKNFDSSFSMNINEFIKAL